jgi:hypothetical protein
MASSLLYILSEDKFERDARPVHYVGTVPWFGELGFKNIDPSYWVQMSLVSGSDPVH